LFYQTPTYTEFFKKLKPYEIGSLIPSLAKSRYYNDEVVGKLCHELVSKFKADISTVEPFFVKIFMEKLMGLEYQRTDSA
jgi:DUF438 domain-containing protein